MIDFRPNFRSPLKVNKEYDIPQGRACEKENEEADGVLNRYYREIE